MAPSPPKTKGKLWLVAKFCMAIITAAPIKLTSLYLPSSTALVEPFISVKTAIHDSGKAVYFVKFDMS